ncbi:MAG: anhydro-N-acetylmuramic acid kinase [Albidovulum sp.]|nr:anhydro-N-acetylmuramic acid kinase [Albidovulum sp.]
MHDPKSIWAIGCMSGTSMDAVDVAAVLTDGERIEKFGKTSFFPFDSENRKTLANANGCWPGDDRVFEAERVVVSAHKKALMDNFTGSVIGFHGQTLAHDPENGRTHQAGDGQEIADATGIATVWDFRTRDMELGGQGAPLAPFFHFALAKFLGEYSPVAFLNLGGIANVSWVDPAASAPESRGALFAFDTGPANSLLDALIQSKAGARCDDGGKISSSGKENRELLEKLLQAPYFAAKAPKSLDRAQFLYALAMLDHQSLEDSAATLAEFTARSVAEGFKLLPSLPSKTIVTGGGVKNLDVMRRLSAALPTELLDGSSVGLSPHALEAQAFAYLAVRVMRGLPISSPSTTGCSEPAIGARISYPSRRKLD